MCVWGVCDGITVEECKAVMEVVVGATAATVVVVAVSATLGVSLTGLALFIVCRMMHRLLCSY